MNPVSKAREIAESLTDNERLQAKLVGILTSNLTAEEINTIYESTRIICR